MFPSSADDDRLTLNEAIANENMYAGRNGDDMIDASARRAAMIDRKDRAMTDTSPHELLALCVLDLLSAQSDDSLQDACDDLCDYIVNIDSGIFTDAEITATMTAAHAIDNAEEYHAAHIRDAFRDNGATVV